MSSKELRSQLQAKWEKAVADNSTSDQLQVLSVLQSWVENHYDTDFGDLEPKEHDFLQSLQPDGELPDTPLFEGTMQKKSTVNRHMWQKRFFVLRENALEYYRDEDDRQLGLHAPTRLPCSDIIECSAPASGKGTEAGRRLQLKLSSTDRVFELLADSRDECQVWLKHFEILLTRNGRSLVAKPPRTAPPCIMQGVLLKKSTVNRHMWQKRYFVLYPKALCYYKSQKARDNQGSQTKKIIPLADVLGAELAATGKGSEGGNRLNLNMTSTRTFELRTENAGEGRLWTDAIEQELKHLRQGGRPRAPAPSPDVTVHEDEEGNVFFYNTKTETSKWAPVGANGSSAVATNTNTTGIERPPPPPPPPMPSSRTASPRPSISMTSSLSGPSSMAGGGVASLGSQLRRFALLYGHKSASRSGELSGGHSPSRSQSMSAPPNSAMALSATGRTVLSKAAGDVAAQLRLYDHDLWGNLKSREFLRKQWTRDGVETTTPNILRCVEVFNKRTYWVGSLLLQLSDVQERADTIKKLIDVVDKCLSTHNYYSAYALFNGLRLSPILRLKKSWALLPARSIKRFAALKETLDTAKNFASYRAMIEKAADAQEAAVPHLQVVLKDLFSLEELTGVENKDQGLDATVNFHKYTKQYKVFKKVVLCQRRGRNASSKRDELVLSALASGERAVLDEDELWALTYVCEPKSLAQALELQWERANDREKRDLAEAQRAAFADALRPIEEARRERDEKEQARRAKWVDREQKLRAEEDATLDELKKALLKLDALLAKDEEEKSTEGGNSSAGAPAQVQSAAAEGTEQPAIGNGAESAATGGDEAEAAPAVAGEPGEAAPPKKKKKKKKIVVRKVVKRVKKVKVGDKAAAEAGGAATTVTTGQLPPGSPGGPPALAPKPKSKKKKAPLPLPAKPETA